MVLQPNANRHEMRPAARRLAASVAILGAAIAIAVLLARSTPTTADRDCVQLQLGAHVKLQARVGVEVERGATRAVSGFRLVAEL